MRSPEGSPTELSDLLARLVRTLEGLGVPYLVTGSVASIAYGEPRFTNDIDVVADVRPEHLPGLRAAFPEDEYYLSERMVLDAILRRGQFNIIQPSTGLKADVILPHGTAFDASRFGRGRRVRPSEQFSATFASPEDVIVKKLEYYRDGGSEKHVRDIAGILRMGGGQIDRSYVAEWADRLGFRDVWNAVLARVNRP